MTLSGRYEEILSYLLNEPWMDTIIFYSYTLHAGLAQRHAGKTLRVRFAFSV